MSETTLFWGILGVGRAGSARARAIADDPRAEGVIGWRGDPAAAGLQVASSVEEVLDAVDAVAVCTSDHTHPRLVEQALKAGKHVVCEFPLAGSARKARQLFRLAEQQQRVLHVEHIELLTPIARWMRAHAAPARFRGGALRFRTRVRPEVFSVAHANVARLHRLVDMVGLPRRFDIDEVSLTHLAGRLRYGAESEVEFEFVMEDGAGRKLEMTIDQERGSMVVIGRHLLHRGVPVDLPEGPGLFLQDQLAATARILDGSPIYIDEQRIVDVLDLADRLHAVGEQLRQAQEARAARPG